MFVRIIKGVFALVLCFQMSSVFIPKAHAASDTAKDTQNEYWPSRIRLSAGGGTEGRGIFYTDELIPLFYTKDRGTLWFLNTKENWQTPNSQEYNMGTGLRHIFNDKFIVGLHYFFDKKLSKNDIWHDQNGIGAEFLSQPFDFRFNWYDPTQKGKGTVTSNYYKLGPMSLLQIGSQEEALGGYDFEFGFPVFEKKTKTRMYLGGFFFDSKLGKDQNGFRVRTETNIFKWLAFDTTFNRWANGQTEVLGDVRVTIPLELGRVKEKKNPFKVTEMDYIHDRLFERVVRDIDVKTATTAPGAIEKDVPGVEIIYADNSNTTGIEDGSLAHPWSTLKRAFQDDRYIGNDGTARYIYVFNGDGSGHGYAKEYTLAENSVLWGSGYNGGFNGIPTPGFPKLTGGLELANNTTVMGLNLHGCDGDAIYGEDISNVTITHNTITGSGGNGIHLESWGHSSNWNITDNTIRGNNDSGINIYNGDPAWDYMLSNVNISGNKITKNAHGIYIENHYPLNGLTISGNNISKNTTVDSGVHIENYSELYNVNISGNRINRNSGPGVYLYNDSNALAENFNISGNTINRNTDAGIRIENYDSTLENFTIAGNRIRGNDRGIYVKSEDQPSETATIHNFTFSGNSIINNDREGIYVKNKYNSTAYDFNFSNNTISGNGDEGIAVWNDENSNAFNFSFTGNNINGNHRDGGIALRNEGGSTASGFTFSNNNITGNSGGFCGIDIYNDSLLEDFTISNNTISGNSGYGIDIYNDRGGLYNLIISNNTITGNTSSGMWIQNAGEMGDVTISGNTVSSNGGERFCGIDVFTDGGYSHDFSFTGNTITGNIGAGIDVFNDYGGDAENFSFNLNTITGNSDEGIEIYNHWSGMSGFSFMGNTITGNGAPIEGETVVLGKRFGGAGINIHNEQAGMSDFTFTANTISNNYGDGFVLYNYHAGADNFTFSLNNVINNAGNGLVFEGLQAGTHNIDLGGGSQGSMGFNIIMGNQGEYDLINDTYDTIYAKGNLGLTPDRIYGDVIY